MYNRFRRCNCMNSKTNTLENVCDNYTGNTTNNQPCGDNTDVAMYENCMCGFNEEQSVFPDNPMLAQSYVPIQTLDTTFTPCCGLQNGTIFPELVSPYEPGQSIQFINYLKSRNEIGEGCNG